MQKVKKGMLWICMWICMPYWAMQTSSAINTCLSVDLCMRSLLSVQVSVSVSDDLCVFSHSVHVTIAHVLRSGMSTWPLFVWVCVCVHACMWLPQIICQSVCFPTDYWRYRNQPYTCKSKRGVVVRDLWHHQNVFLCVCWCKYVYAYIHSLIDT